MAIKWFSEKVRYEIQAYEITKGYEELRRTHVSFCGSPRRHPHDQEKIVLIVDLLSTNPFYYEFRSEDISHVEKLPSLVNLEGETVFMAQIWVKKESVGICCRPFLVEDS